MGLGLGVDGSMVRCCFGAHGLPVYGSCANVNIMSDGFKACLLSCDSMFIPPWHGFCAKTGLFNSRLPQSSL